MQSQWHTLPAINGVDQGAGAEFRARDVVFTPGRDAVRFSLDIAPAYPTEAKVTRWRREVTLDRKKGEVVLAEDYLLGEAREPVRLHFVTPLAPDVSTRGRVILSRPGRPPISAGGEAGPVLAYDPKRFAAAVEEQAVDDSRLQPTSRPAAPTASSSAPLWPTRAERGSTWANDRPFASGPVGRAVLEGPPGTTVMSRRSGGDGRREIRPRSSRYGLD
jgi:hypothetical protein